ncbi:MAG: hypothetical protein ACRD4W_07565 [Nitrososphaeraceae archaeon]
MSSFVFDIMMMISIISSFGMITIMNPLFDLMYVQGQHQSSEHHNSDMNKMARNMQIGNSTDNILSPYTAEQNRTIKSLSGTDVLSLQSGTGEVYGGLAISAELNGYPGPRHVLDLASELNVTEEQQIGIEVIYNNMRNQAVLVGLQIIEIEKQVENSFANNTIKEQSLQMLLDLSSHLYGQLRYIHLSSHLKVMDALTPQQVNTYNEIRGYE